MGRVLLIGGGTNRVTVRYRRSYRCEAIGGPMGRVLPIGGDTNRVTVRYRRSYRCD